MYQEHGVRHVRRKRRSTIASLQDYITLIQPRIILHSHVFPPYVPTTDPGLIVRLGTRSAASPSDTPQKASTDPSHAWAGLEPGAGFMCWLRTERKQRRGAETGTLPKGRRVLWSWQDAASSFLSVSQVAADGTMGADERDVGLPCSCPCAGNARTLQEARPARKNIRGSHLLLHRIHWLSSFLQVKGYASALILWTWSSVTFQSVRSPFQDSAGPLGASLSHVISDNMTHSNVFVQTYSCSRFPLASCSGCLV